MRIRSVRVTNFRSIKDSGEVMVGDVSCLVGKNESGKTNFLQALVRQNPAPGQPSGFDLDDDYPRQELGPVAERLKDPEAARPLAVAVTYELSEEEWGALVAEFGEGTIKLDADRNVVISRDYSNERTLDFDVDESAAVAHLVKQHELPFSGAPVETLSALVTRLNNEDVISGYGTARTVAYELSTTGLWEAVASRIDAIEPTYLYFDEYASLPGEGNVRELLERRQSGNSDLTAAQRTFLALVDEARIDLDVLATHEYKVIRNRLESASINISKELYRFWSQNQNSRIDFDHTYEHRLGAGVPSRDDLILKLLVEDTRYGVSVPVDQRSHGFVWFFSFLVNFSQIREHDRDRSLVLLLDEPGTALHGLAQRDFLRMLDERLADYQVLYTTHQPFLVDPDRLDRARPVVDDGDSGTKISNNPYKVDRDTLFPLQAALGYEIGQTLFVAPNVLLVEGTSDLIYLSLLSRAAERSGASGLDPRWTITPVGGIDKMDTFIRLFGANQLNTCVLVDVSGRQTRIDRLVKDGDLDAGQVIRVTDVVSAEKGDIEDLFAEGFYLSLLHGLAAEDPQRAIYAAVQKTNLPPKADEPRITRRIDDVLATFNQAEGLDHLAPALYFERHQDELLHKVDKTTVERAAKLFGLINAQLRK